MNTVDELIEKHGFGVKVREDAYLPGNWVTPKARFLDHRESPAVPNYHGIDRDGNEVIVPADRSIFYVFDPKACGGSVDELMAMSVGEEVRLIHKNDLLGKWFTPKFKTKCGEWHCLTKYGDGLCIDGDDPVYRFLVDSPGPVKTEFRYLWFDKNGRPSYGSSLYSEEEMRNGQYHDNMIKAEWSKTEMAI